MLTAAAAYSAQLPGALHRSSGGQERPGQGEAGREVPLREVRTWALREGWGNQLGEETPEGKSREKALCRWGLLSFK